ncbi:hypothetical protein GOC53_14875 [Sinorhizobium medicae]|uniref:hypothetical protein n=1 Tax=Rhizobium meliloti TaxID=382 RepID=UPI000B497FEF|nr:hypothetical protein [Sinorhizobium meliloti]ASP51469.1 hypothetical protein CDO31_07730 [Sinorhizobium meliloti]MDX0491545.1 hypothetical protein [Sinorhizobium medicae]
MIAPLPDGFQRHRESFSGGDLRCLVVLPDGSGFDCRPVAGRETMAAEHLSRDELIAMLLEFYGLAAFRGN